MILFLPNFIQDRKFKQDFLRLNILLRWSFWRVCLNQALCNCPPPPGCCNEGVSSQLCGWTISSSPNLDALAQIRSERSPFMMGEQQLGAAAGEKTLCSGGLWTVRRQVKRRTSAARTSPWLSSGSVSVSAVQRLPSVQRASQEPQSGAEAAGPHRPHQMEAQHLRPRPQRQGRGRSLFPRLVWFYLRGKTCLKHAP